MIRTVAERTLHQNPERQLLLRCGYGTASSIFESVLAIRRTADDALPFYSFDEYSMHYVVFHSGQPVGTLTTPRTRDGLIDCQSCYPPQLIDQYRKQIVSACKFRISSNPHSGMFLLRLMIREAWRDQLADGARLDVINVERKLVPFYRRIGYVALQGWDFVHPTLGTDSVPLILPADPTRRSFCQDLFASVDDPLLLTDVQAVLDRGALPIKRAR
jgi:hypothetical protein